MRAELKNPKIKRHFTSNEKHTNGHNSLEARSF